ncbi:MAG: OmpH family outer membrane protein [bacterium]
MKDMRKSLLILGAVLFFAVKSVQMGLAQLKPPDVKVGVVNSELLMEGYPEFRKAQEQLEREMLVWQKEREEWVKDMEARQAQIIDKEKQLELGQATFTEKRKKELRTEIDSLKTDLQNRYNRQLNFEQERLARRKAELIGQVIEEVNKVIEEVGKAEGFDVIIDAANGTVVYARDPIDLNDKVLNLLRKK